MFARAIALDAVIGETPTSVRAADVLVSTSASLAVTRARERTVADVLVSTRASEAVTLPRERTVADVLASTIALEAVIGETGLATSVRLAEVPASANAGELLALMRPLERTVADVTESADALDAEIGETPTSVRAADVLVSTRVSLAVTRPRERAVADVDASTIALDAVARNLDLMKRPEPRD